MQTEKIKKDPYQEALRYIDNAKQILRERAIKKGEFYTDPKFVRMACNTAWMGVLIALKGKMEQNGFKFPSRNRMNVDIYRDYLAKRNKSILNYFNEAYNYLHLFGGYDGDLHINTSQTGVQLAMKIIEWCK
jgi:hypothetical protein